MQSAPPCQPSKNAKDTDGQDLEVYQQCEERLLRNSVQEMENIHRRTHKDDEDSLKVTKPPFPTGFAEDICGLEGDICPPPA